MIARALSMHWVFAVEWNRQLRDGERGEHGVAVLSRWPIGNAVLIRHTPVNDWYAEDTLFGGRPTLGVDLKIRDRLVRFYASHLDTRGGDDGRAMQGAEIRADAAREGAPQIQIVGGDLNTWTCNPLVADCTQAPEAETVIEDFLAEGWSDATDGFNGHTHVGAGFFPQRLDWLFLRGASGVAGRSADAGGSDHKPVFFDLQLP
jgi:endonuclease/exonuclease/phosphatase family metal-dependent hydrolase